MEEICDSRVTQVNLIKITEKLQREIRYLEPNGASKRTLYALPQTFDKAEQEMYSMQQRFDNEREQLISRLNSPIKQGLTKKLSILRLKPLRNEHHSPKRTERSSRPQYTPCKSPGILRTSEQSMKKLMRIKAIMDSCSDLDRGNKTDRNAISGIKKLSRKQYKNANDMVTAIEYMGPTNEAKSFERFKKHIINTENSLFQENSPATISATRIESNFYLESKLRRKNLWKR